jgi:hypothetical protein
MFAKKDAAATAHSSLAVSGNLRANLHHVSKAAAQVERWDAALLTHETGDLLPKRLRAGLLLSRSFGQSGVALIRALKKRVSEAGEEATRMAVLSELAKRL